MLSIIVSVFFYSCNKNSDPELGVFKAFESCIDMSLKNQFDTSLLYNEWSLSKVTFEVYYDGHLSSEKDVTCEWNNLEIILRNDNTAIIGDERGQRLYSHNYLMWTPGYWALEVVKLDKEILQLKWEDKPVGQSFVPFFVNKGGEHHFYVFEYLAR